ncbi:hypothetical protein OAP18_01535 [Gammaproteobacteria bacterium]|nr:hypothetical protein [Gammaproteobacteria bacterium]
MWLGQGSLIVTGLGHAVDATKLSQQWPVWVERMLLVDQENIADRH